MSFLKVETESQVPGGLGSLASALDVMPEAALAVNRQGVITFSNENALELFGYSRGELVGQAVELLVPHDVQGDHVQHRQGFVVSSSKRKMRSGVLLRGAKKDGTVFPADISIFSIEQIDGPVSIVLVSDMTEEKLAEDHLSQLNSELELRSEERAAELDRFFSMSLDMLCIADVDGHFKRLNPSWQRTLGYSLEELMATPYIGFVHPDDVEMTLQEVRMLLAGGHDTADFENRYRHRNGGYRRIAWSASLHANLIYATARDVTERKEIERALSEAKDEAEKANLAKSEFLSRMSHELRTPFNAILGFAQVLEMSGLSDRQLGFVRQITKGGSHLLSLVNEALDISCVESGTLMMSIEPVEIIPVVSEAASLMRSLAQQSSVTISIESRECELVYVSADRQRLSQVLLNLISNAIKYNVPGGSILLRCERNHAGRVEISVVDTGQGIPLEFRNRLFTPFDRLGSERTEIEGTGLGLTLSQSLVKAMSGTLTARWEQPVGSTFVVSLPEVADPAEGYGQRVLDASRGDLIVEPRRILYIEDNLANMQLLQEAYRDQPFVELVPAMQGRVGLDLARQHVPDLVLLDLNLPDISGREVLEEMKADPVLSSIPVIVISADATKGSIARLMSAGAHGYMTKPIDLSELFRLVNTALIGQGGTA